MIMVGVGGKVNVMLSRLLIPENRKSNSFDIRNLDFADLLMGLVLVSINYDDVAFKAYSLVHQHACRRSVTCQLFLISYIAMILIGCYYKVKCGSFYNLFHTLA